MVIKNQVFVQLRSSSSSRMLMRWPSFLLCSILVLSCHHASSFQSKIDNATDRHALLSFKSTISGDPTGSLASWNDSVHFCHWPGITCGRLHPQRVVSLALRSLGLAGSISPAIANLTFLRAIDLSSNQFHGHIPQEIGRLSRLQHLNLSTNSLQGGIPETLSNCSQLQRISMRDNMLTGNVPALTNLSFLSGLSFGTNQLTGRIPGTIGNLCSLSSLSLANNQLAGGMPPSIGKLSKLTALALSNNQLTGNIPPSLWNLSSLSRIFLAYNNLSGSLPPDTGHSLPLIESIDLYYNQIHGHIPLSLSNASSLQHMDLSFNRLSGTIPPNLGSLRYLEWVDLDDNMLEADGWGFIDGLINCTRLQLLQINNNKLGGVLPHSIANLSAELEVLSMDGNGISGSLPPGIGNLVGMTNLDLGPNLLTGPIPASIGMLQNLRALDLDDNKLSGEIPRTLGNLTQLISLYLDYNELTGNIPASLGNCRNLNLLNLGSNKLTGGIPKEILMISTLSRGLRLSFNSLTGPIPSEVGDLRNLGIFDVGMNKLSGELPTSIGGCQELEQLFLRGNFFTGTIPSSLSALRGIQELDLSQNNLSGRIPDFLQDFRFMSYLNLSFNDFEGEVPMHGVFANASAFFALGNDKICGGSPELQFPACPSQPAEKKHDSHWLLISSVSASSLFLFLLVCVLAACCCLQKFGGKQPDSAPASEQEMISYTELARATNGFSEENLIGSGSFARVYRGILHEDDDGRKIVAVKVLNLHMRGASKSFIAECEALRNVRHRNLVKIITVCSSMDSKGSEFKAVVLEFMANGSLEDWLHPRENEQQPGRRKLNLTHRLNIAIDVASALDYLHHYGEMPIIHCDLKPSNVLLDDDMTAHVSDFGLAKVLKKLAGESSQCSTNSAGLKGTVGYIPPEYGMANKVSTRGDVYSYGTLLLEMFTAKSPTDDVFTEGLGLRRFVELAFPDRVADVIDTRLLSLEGTEEIDDVQRMDVTGAIECIASVLRIGILCSKEEPTERFGMGEAIRELHKIKTRFLTYI